MTKPDFCKKCKFLKILKDAIYIFELFFVENHVYEDTKKSGTFENEKQKVHIYTTLFQNQNDIKNI